MKKPLISIIVPTYNREQLLKNTITSLLNQNYLNIEILIVNDGGEDKTLLSLINKHNDGRIKLYSIPHSGVSTAKNYGIKKSKGKYIAFCDDDDQWKSEKLQKQIDFFNKNEKIKIQYCGIIYKNTGDTFFIPINNNPLITLLKKNIIHTSTFIAEKKCFNQVGLFDENMKIIEDYDLFLRLAEKYRIFFLEECFIEKNVPKVRLSKDVINMTFLTHNLLFKYLKKYKKKIPLKYYLKYKSINYFNRGKWFYFQNKSYLAMKNLLLSIIYFPINVRPLLFLPFLLLSTNLFDKLIPVYSKMRKRKYLKYT